MNQDKELAALLPLARSFALSMGRRWPHLRNELLAAAMVGAWDIVRQHRGKPYDELCRLANVRIRGAILDEIRANNWLPGRVKKRPGEYTTVVSLSDMRLDEEAVAPCQEREVEIVRRMRLLRQEYGHLSERQKYVLASSFIDERTLLDIGRELGVSEAMASKLRSCALKRLRTKLRAQER